MKEANKISHQKIKYRSKCVGEFSASILLCLLQVLSLFPVPFAAWTANKDSLFTYYSSHWLLGYEWKEEKADGKMTLEESKISGANAKQLCPFSFKMSRH